jgi:hypothetical protein
MDRRILTVATLTLLLVALAATPASAQATTVTSTGPVQAGAFLELTCPEGTIVQYTQGRDADQRPSLVLPQQAVDRPGRDQHDARCGAGVGGVERAQGRPLRGRVPGVRAATGDVRLRRPVRGGRRAGHGAVPAGDPVRVGGQSDLISSGLRRELPARQTRITDDAGQWIGVSFTAPEPGSYSGTLDCQWRPFE